MAYTINRTNGLNPIVIPDGTINTSTSLTLIGKNYPNYGAILDQNFITLLENSASANKPAAPITGQLWWDSSHKTLKVNIDGGSGDSSWKNVGSTTAQATAPTGNNKGDLWWDTSGSGQLFAWDGNAFILIGPIGGAAGIVSETIVWSDGTSSTDVLSMTIGDQRYVIISPSISFTPLTPIPGFSTINPGLNLISSVALSNSQFTGKASDAAALQGITASRFMRTDINTATTGTINVNNNNGLYVGTSSDLHLNVTTPNVAVINETNNGHMGFKVHDSSGTQRTGINIYPNGNVICNYDLIVGGNFSLSNSTNDLVITGTSRSINPQTGALRLTVGGLGVAGNINTGGSQNNFVGNVTAANLNSNAVVSATTVVTTDLYGTIGTPAQPYITSLGTLTSLTTSGTVGAYNYTGLISTNAQPYITSVGTLSSITVSGNSYLGPVGNVRITGGSAGQYMVTDGAGNLSWASISGSSNQVPYFLAGTLTGTANLTYNGSILYVNGGINATGDITAFYSSDYRLKTNVEPISNALDKVDLLRGVTFNWNELATNKDMTIAEAGVIAQEVQAVLPEVVTEREDGYLAVKYDKIVPLLIQAIKELRAEVEILKAAK